MFTILGIKQLYEGADTDAIFVAQIDIGDDAEYYEADAVFDSYAEAVAGVERLNNTTYRLDNGESDRPEYLILLSEDVRNIVFNLDYDPCNWDECKCPQGTADRCCCECKVCTNFIEDEYVKLVKQLAQKTDELHGGVDHCTIEEEIKKGGVQ